MKYAIHSEHPVHRANAARREAFLAEVVRLMQADGEDRKARAERKARGSRVFKG